MSEKEIQVISSIYEKNAPVNVGNETISWFHIKFGVKQGYDLSSFVCIILMAEGLRSTEKAKEEQEIQRRGQTFLDLDYADNFYINFKTFFEFRVLE